MPLWSCQRGGRHVRRAAHTCIRASQPPSNLAGADIVDGSPVLDVKPFVPFCDNVPTAAAPSWVAAEVRRGGSLHTYMTWSWHTYMIFVCGWVDLVSAFVRQQPCPSPPHRPGWQQRWGREGGGGGAAQKRPVCATPALLGRSPASPTPAAPNNHSY